MKTIVNILFSAFILFFTSDSFAQERVDNQYSFFVAGHVYGFPRESLNHIGVHPPFKNKLNLIKNNDLIEFGVFTGDIVEAGANENEWDEVDMDISYINKKTYFAPGNHDIGSPGKRAIFRRRYGETYQQFKHKNDLIIILDPNIDKWSISGDQLLWLQSVLFYETKGIDNVFVFFHQILWWNKENIYKNFRINSRSGRAEKINFWDEIYPMFKRTKKPVFMFAGDTGVYEDSFMYHKSNNITLIASGMGRGKKDNFIIANIKKDKSVEFELISLNGDDINSLGKLEDYVLE